MERWIQGFLFTFLAIGLGVCLVRVATLSGENADLIAQNAMVQSRLATLEKHLLRDHADGPSELAAQVDRTQKLQQRVADQKLATEAARKRLEQERAGGSSIPSGDQATVLKEKIEQQKKIVDELQANLRDVRAQEGAIKRQMHTDQTNQALDQKTNTDQINAQIAQQQQALDQLTPQLAAARQAYGNNQFDMQAAQSIKDLGAQLTAARTAIQALKDQRATDGLQRTQLKNVALAQSQQQLDSLQTNEQALQDQLTQERETLHSLQNDLSGGVPSQDTRRALIRGAEMDYQFQSSRLDELQTRLEAEQAKLLQYKSGP